RKGTFHPSVRSDTLAMWAAGKRQGISLQHRQTMRFRSLREVAGNGVKTCRPQQIGQSMTGNDLHRVLPLGTSPTVSRFRPCRVSARDRQELPQQGERCCCRFGRKESVYGGGDAFAAWI